MRYVDGCPNWIDAESHVREALETLGEDAEILRQRIDSEQDALAMRFTGSPTILVNGVDPFAVDVAGPGLACRLYPTSAGPRGTPTVEQLLTALSAARA